MQGIDFSLNKVTSMCFLVTTHVFHTIVLQFKNAISVSNKYLVEWNISLKVTRSWHSFIQLSGKKLCMF